MHKNRKTACDLGTEAGVVATRMLAQLIREVEAGSAQYPDARLGKIRGVEVGIAL